MKRLRCAGVPAEQCCSHTVNSYEAAVIEPDPTKALVDHRVCRECFEDVVGRLEGRPLSQRDAGRLIHFAQLFQAAMNVDGPVMPGEHMLRSARACTHRGRRLARPT